MFAKGQAGRLATGVFVLLGMLAAFAPKPAAASPYTVGTKNVLLLIMAFSDQQAPPPAPVGNTGPLPSDSEGLALMQNVSAFYENQSFGKTKIQPAVRSVQLTGTAGASTAYQPQTPLAVYNAAVARAESNGFDTGQFDFIVVLYSLRPFNGTTSYPQFGGGFGQGTHANIGSPGAWVNCYNEGTFPQDEVAQQLGRNFGAYRANTWLSFFEGTSIGFGQTLLESNPFDVMGFGPIPNGHFMAAVKNRLDWLPTGNGIEVIEQEATSSGEYTIRAIDVPTNPTNGPLPLALKIRRSNRNYQNSGDNYWVEYRQNSITNFDQQGALISWNYSNYSENASTDLIDTRPETKPTQDAILNPDVTAFYDAPLAIGRTLDDLDAKPDIHITPLEKDTANGTMKIRVEIGTYATNTPPTAQITLPADGVTVAAGAPVSFTATANDTDGDQLHYYWDFGDANVFGTTGSSDNDQPTQTHTYTGNNREYQVHLMVSDGKGGVAHDSITIKVGVPNTRRISGRVTMKNAPLVPVADVLVRATSTDNFFTQPYYGYTDADGYYTIVGIPVPTADPGADPNDPIPPDPYQLQAGKENYIFEPANFTNPVMVDFSGPAELTNRNFHAIETDFVVPSVEITTPVDGAELGNLTAITGTASDNAGGSSVESVLVSLKNTTVGSPDEGKFFNWNNGNPQWVTVDDPNPGTGTGTPEERIERAAPKVAATFTPDSTPSKGVPFDWSVPSGSFPSTLAQGDYIITATSADFAGNTASDAAAITLTTGGGTGGGNTGIDLDSTSAGSDYSTTWVQPGQTNLAPNGTVTETDGVVKQIEITFTPQDGASEVLSATPSGGITVTPGNGSLLLSGDASPAAYQTVLRTVTYQNSAASPTGALRTFKFDLYGNDTTTVSATGTTTITLQDRGPGISEIDLDADNSSGADDPDFFAVWDQAGLTPIADTDARVTNFLGTAPNQTVGSLTKIVVTIQDRQDDLSEVLSATANSGVTVSYDAPNGVLTLRAANGTASPAEFQNVLRTVKYKNNAAVINGTSRNFEFRVFGGQAEVLAHTLISTGGGAGTGNSTLDLDADDSSDAVAPGQLPPNGYLAEWDQENQTVLVDTDAVVGNDAGTLTKITVTIQDRQDDLSEVLSATANSGVTVSYDAPNGVLTLQAAGNGSASVAEFQNVLRTVKYINNAATINGTSRTFEFRVFGGVDEVTAQTIISTDFSTGPVTGPGVSAIDLDANDSTGATGSDYQGIWNKAAATPITDTDARVTNLVPPANTPGMLTSITVTILDREDDISEVLSATAVPNVTVSYDAPSGVLTLQAAGNGGASAAEFQNVLRSVRYKNNAAVPNGDERNFEVRVFGGTNEPTALSTISTDAISTPGGISQIDLNGADSAGVNVTRLWQFGATNVLTDGDALVLNSSNNIQRITVTINNRQDGLDEVLSATAAGAVTVAYDAPNGVLTLSGPATPAEFQNVVRSVRYSNNLETPTGTSRSFQFEVFGGVEDPRASAIATLTRNASGSDGSDVDTDGDGIPDSEDKDDDGDGIPDDQDLDTPGGGTDGDSDGSMGGYSSRLDLNGAAPGYNFKTKWNEEGATNLAAPDATIQDTTDEIQKLVVTMIDGDLIVGESLTATSTAGLTLTTASGTLTLSGPASRSAFEAAIRSIVYTNPRSRGKTRRFRFDLYGTVDGTTADTVTSVAYTTISVDDRGNSSNKLFNGSVSVANNVATITYQVRNITGAPLSNILITGNLIGGRPHNQRANIESVTPSDSSVTSRWNNPGDKLRILDPSRDSKGVRWFIPSLDHGEEATLVITVPLRNEGFGNRVTTAWTADFTGQARNETVDPLTVP